MADEPKSKVEPDHEVETTDAAAARIEEENRVENLPAWQKNSQGLDLFAQHEAQATGESYRESEAERKSRKRRSIAIALGIAGFVILIYAITLLKLSGNV